MMAQGYYGRDFAERTYSLGSYLGTAYTLKVKLEFLWADGAGNGNIHFYTFIDHNSIVPVEAVTTVNGTQVRDSESNNLTYSGWIAPSSNGTYTVKVACKVGLISALEKTVDISALLPTIPQQAPRSSCSMAYNRETGKFTCHAIYGDSSNTVPLVGGQQVFTLEWPKWDDYSMRYPPAQTGQLMTGLQDYTMTTPKYGKHIEGESLTYSFEAVLINGKRTKTTHSYQVPATVHSVHATNQQLEVGQSKKIQYTLVNEYGASNFQITGVYYNYSGSSISIDDDGTITALSAGITTVEIVSKDYTRAGTTIKITVIGADDYPFPSEETTDYLTVDYIDRCVDAITRLATKHTIAILPTDNYNRYSTDYSYLHAIIEILRSNTRSICNTLGVAYPAIIAEPLPFIDNGKKTYILINEILRLLYELRTYA